VSDPADPPQRPGIGLPPSLPEIHRPSLEAVLESLPSKEDVVRSAQSVEEIVRRQPSVDELLGRDG
jgi:hypothetical protein